MPLYSEILPTSGVAGFRSAHPTANVAPRRVAARSRYGVNLRGARTGEFTEAGNATLPVIGCV